MTRETIARYEIRSELGRGGMATVYLAYDPNFRRNVAIKVVSVNLQENRVFRERFEREAHLIAKIEHPAIVPVYDFGEQDNQPYLVMRYMPGGTLADKIKGGALTFREAAQIISQIAPALDAVHAQGVVHRDLKPGNILFDAFGNPAISDFGIAYLTAITTDLTGSAIIGTPSYMSPEQVRGDDNLDGRSDVYALGVILFEMLTGRGPYHAGTPLSVALKHLTDPIPSIRSFRPDLPMEVELIMNKAMAKERELRYPNASELALELRAIPDVFQGSKTPAISPVRTPHGEEISTEMDVAESSQPGFDSFSPPQLEASPVASQSNTDHSQKFPTDKAIQPGYIDGSSKPLTGSRQPSRRILQIAAIVGLGLFLVILCSSVGLFGILSRLGLSGLFPGQSPTVLPSLTATHTSDIQEIVLFSDDFSDPLSGWPTIQNARGGYSYQPDGYNIFVDEIGAALWAKTEIGYANSSVSVDAKPVIEGKNGHYGLLCRIQQDEQNFYYFVIQGNGDYTIGKHKNTGFQSLFSDGWRQSDAINQGSQTNRLKADCVGNTLRLYVNNALLDEATDTDFTSGFSGLLAASLDSEGFEVLFNNFRITAPTQ